MRITGQPPPAPNVESTSSWVTVAILAQGTSWADAETQAFYYMPVGFDSAGRVLNDPRPPTFGPHIPGHAAIFIF
jgi:hypothetical protein